MNASIRIASCRSVNQPGWLALRQSLWPDVTEEDHLADAIRFLGDPERYAQFIAYADDDRPIGFAEASLRTDYVNGTGSSPVAFLEGIYVVPEARRSGVATRLVGEVTQWACRLGCRELASDALLDNETSHAMHHSLDFQETERVVYFRKLLSPDQRRIPTAPM
jgi:aminoglycoside 6'-N-acetyltransferase I